VVERDQHASRELPLLGVLQSGDLESRARYGRVWEMWGLDELIAGHAGSAPLAIAVSALLGLRHATDPDHLVAVSTLVATEPERPTRRAGLLGLSWGLGHATTLTALGLPIVLFAVSLPGSVERAAEFIIGLVIAGLGLRLSGAGGPVSSTRTSMSTDRSSIATSTRTRARDTRMRMRPARPCRPTASDSSTAREDRPR
jgi:hypothetical protein